MATFSQPASSGPQAASILVVDDDDLVRTLVSEVLADAGFRVRTLSSAFQLNQAIRHERPHLILLDVRMPALRGDRAAEILRRHRFARGIPIVLFSDSEADELDDLVATTGATGFVRKTPGYRGLAEALGRWLPVPQGGRTADQNNLGG